MVSLKYVGNWKWVGLFIIICAVVLSPFTGIAFGEEKKVSSKQAAQIIWATPCLVQVQINLEDADEHVWDPGRCG